MASAHSAWPWHHDADEIAVFHVWDAGGIQGALNISVLANPAFFRPPL